ncbi:MAG: hypothetical protein LBV49_09520 [Azonexus sp.]|jgi:ubiquinone biosynthesis protein UbiJ|nr:hypothetical protein [Azonexus sp.]
MASGFSALSQRVPLAALNHLLADASWARERLRPFAGSVVRIEGGLPMPLLFGIDQNGLLTLADREEPATVTLTLPADTPARLLLDRANLFAAARIEGPADLSEALAFVFRHLTWDAEADLARWFGDIAAHRLTRLGRHLTNTAREGLTRLAGNAAEYAQHESGLLANREAISAFAAEVNALRDDLARLEKRLQRL